MGRNGTVNRPTSHTAPTAILLISIAILVGLYLASIGPYWNINPDGAGYVRWAKEVAAGEGFGRPFHQPVTSFVFAAILVVFPDGYTALNAATQFLILISLAFAYALFARQGGRRLALLAVLLSLASIHLYGESTLLMSEPTYMFFTFGALLLLDRSSPNGPGHQTGRTEPASGGRTWLREGLAGVFLVLSAMTRSIGITLSLAVLLVEGTALVRRDRRPRVLLVAFALLALLAVPLWEMYAGQQYVSDWLGMFLRDDPDVTSSGKGSLIGVLTRMVGNIERLPVGPLLLNTPVWDDSSLGVLWTAGGVLTFALGLGLALRTRVSVTNPYVLLYLVVVAVHMLLGGFGAARHLVPVLPLLFYFMLEAVRRLDVVVQGGFRATWPTTALRGVGAIYLIAFVGLGIETAAAGVREAHSSPFGDYPIKRRSNYDAQRLALLLKQISRPEDRYAVGQHDMWDAVTERGGAHLPAGDAITADSFTAWIEDKGVRYILLDHLLFARSNLRVVMYQNPQMFRVLSALPEASLYEVRPRKE